MPRNAGGLQLASQNKAPHGDFNGTRGRIEGIASVFMFFGLVKAVTKVLGLARLVSSGKGSVPTGQSRFL